VSLATIEQTVAKDVREGVQNAINWLTQVAETHLPTIEADVKAVAGSAIFKAAEAALLTPAEEAFAARFISEIANLRAKPAGDSVPAEGNGDAPGGTGDQSAS
jgi:hypothetical protein